MTELHYIEGHIIGQNYKPGLHFDFKIAVPVCEAEEFALLVEHDGLNGANVNALLRLADEGAAPYCICVGVAPGYLSMSDGSRRDMRMNSYDLFDREYGDFLVYELLPYITETYSLRISPSPEMHLISGGSSGGISAFAAAWFHPDDFRKVYMSSPSFLAMGRGNEIPYLIRKYETKPLRIYEEYSENEPNDYFGWSRAIDEEARAALVFAGYDFCCEYFPGEGHCSRYGDENEAYRRMRWLFGAASASGNSPRVAQVIPEDSRWEKCDAFPASPVQETTALDDRFDTVVKSNDGLAWYCANRHEDIVYMFPVDAAGADVRGLLHAALHTIPRYEPKGVIDMAVDRADRLFVLTAIGIQCVRSYGLIDVIFALPDASVPLAVAIGDALYVKTEQGIYRRALCDISLTESEARRRFVSYYD